jgi:hypothetical protein
MSNLEDKNKILEKDKAKLIRKINTLEERIRMGQMNKIDTSEQLYEGR